MKYRPDTRYWYRYRCIPILNVSPNVCLFVRFPLPCSLFSLPPSLALAYSLPLTARPPALPLSLTHILPLFSRLPHLTPSHPLLLAPSQEEVRRAQVLKDEGNSFVKKGQYQKAVEKYSQSLKLNPTEITTLTNRSVPSTSITPLLLCQSCSVYHPGSSWVARWPFVSAAASQQEGPGFETRSNAENTFRCAVLVHPTVHHPSTE